MSAGLRAGYKQTEVGVIPEDWDARGLGHFWSVTDCKHVTAQFVLDGFPLASIKEVQSRFVDLTNAKQTTAHFYNLLIEGGRKPRPGDMILSRNATVGEVAQVADWHPPFAMGQDVCLLRKKSESLSTEFLQAIFRSPVILNQLANLMVGSTFKRANVQQIRNFSVPMPPPLEQRAIAAALSDVDALLGGLDRLIAKKRDLKQAAMQQLLTGQTRLPGFSGEWVVKQLGDVLTRLANGALYQPSNSSGLPVTRIETIAYGAVDMCRVGYGIQTSELEEYRMQPGDILFSHINSVDHIGKVALYSGAPPLYHGMNLLLFRAGSSLDSRYLFYRLGSRQGRKQSVTLARQAVSQASINTSDLKLVEILFPPLLEQTAIATILSDMDTELAALQTRRSKTQALKQAMMQELLTGRIRLV